MIPLPQSDSSPTKSAARLVCLLAEGCCWCGSPARAFEQSYCWVLKLTAIEQGQSDVPVLNKRTRPRPPEPKRAEETEHRHRRHQTLSAVPRADGRPEVLGAPGGPPSLPRKLQRSRRRGAWDHRPGSSHPLGTGKNAVSEEATRSRNSPTARSNCADSVGIQSVTGTAQTGRRARVGLTSAQCVGLNNTECPKVAMRPPDCAWPDDWPDL